jgi:hypothetical protein
MMEEVRNPIKSASWNSNSTFAAETGLNKDGKLPRETEIQQGETAHIVAGTHAPHQDHGSPAGNPAAANRVSRLELKPWWRSYGMTDEDRAVAVSWTIE